MNDPAGPQVSRRRLLRMIGEATSSAVMYQAMTSLGHAAEFHLQRPGRARRAIRRAPRSSSWAPGSPAWSRPRAAQGRLQGETARIPKAGGRAELVAARRRQLYRARRRARRTAPSTRDSTSIPGPGAFPIIIARCSTIASGLGVRLEPFIQLNYNAYLHASGAFGGKPQRFRHIKADYNGHVSELLAKATDKDKLDDAVSAEDKEILLQALRAWGALDQRLRLSSGISLRARFAAMTRHPGGGLDGAPSPSTPLGLQRHPELAAVAALSLPAAHDFQTHDVPAGRRHGHDRQGLLQREVGDLIQLDAKVTAIQPGREGRHRHLSRRASGGGAAASKRRLVRLHHPALDPEPDRDQCRRPDAGRDRRRALCGFGEDRPAVQAPLLGGGRGDLWRHHLHGSADRADLLSEHGLPQGRQGRAARRLQLRRCRRPSSPR